LQWTFGGIYRRARGTIPYEVSYFGAPGPVGTPLPPAFVFQQDSLSKSWAVFGDASYAVTDRFTLGAGLRYFKDDQTFTSGTTQTGEFDATNPRFYGQYKLSQNASLYASASKGFRSGGFNALNQPSFTPENLWTYELGNKVALAGGRVRLDTAIFYSRYDDYQIYGFVPLPDVGPIGITSNAGSAKIQGTEWLLGWQPTDDWTFNFGGSYVESEFTRITSDNSSYVEGDPIDGFPEYSFTVSAQRDFELGGRPAFTRVDYTEQDHLTYRNRSIGPWYFSQSAVINMLNLNASVQWNDNLSLGVFGQNQLDDRGYTGVASIEGFAGRSRPRTYGVRFAMSFD
jgi:outer membrane receptor protein involved in Fe transport